jgi:pimeloyl-ACP methyl ester carboxylesterase
VRGEFLDLSGARLYYYAAGTRGAGNPVVLLHGFPTSSHLWNDVVPLMPAGHRIVVLDLLGYGRSDRPLGRPLDVDAHADRVVEVMNELRIERACIVGHGVGGGIAQSLAVRYAGRVSHLGLVDSVAFDRWPTLAARMARWTLPLSRFLPADVLLGVLRHDLQSGYRDPERAARSIELYLRPFTGGDGRDALVAHVRALGARHAASFAPKLEALDVPTAVVWGGRDQAVRVSVGRRLHDTIHHSTLEVLDDRRHFTPEEAPREVADSITRLLAR